MRIITISREFGSGGRELGKRLADVLHFDYYDKEILTAIAENQGMDESYVARELDCGRFQNIPLTFRSSFAGMASARSAQTELLLEQKRVIETIASVNRDCVIVGRNADVLLQSHHPFNLFVCAEMEAKIRRCAERSPAGEQLTPREIERKIRRIDKNREETREIMTDRRWGERHAYHLTVNTTDWDIRELVSAVAEFAERWFGRAEA